MVYSKKNRRCAAFLLVLVLLVKRSALRCFSVGFGMVDSKKLALRGFSVGFGIARLKNSALRGFSAGLRILGFLGILGIPGIPWISQES